jgi:branched-chain amino acid transport system ATP-binding protein
VVNELYALIPRIKERGVGIVVVEQDIARSLDIADRFYCLLEGRVVLSGRPVEVARDTVVQHYFGL